MELAYAGEHLFFKHAGHLAIVLSFTASLLSSIAYFFHTRHAAQLKWKQLARAAFRVHSIAVFTVIGLLLYMLANHHFEYYYVWQHSSMIMPLRYLLSSFWEGQEGSFLLWMFWHVVLGNILIWRAKQWESPVMTTFSGVQVFLSSMLLGIYIADVKIGSNPIVTLLREHPDFQNLPLFNDVDYLSKIDGRGLNPLLQNYWMTIHPPTLFLGFSATLIPFCYAIAGLWKKSLESWVKPAIPWTFFAVGILGVGILMGGAWAYEALSFGGFWAWDPVENASLVPWLTLVCAAHLMLIQQAKGTSLFAVFGFTLISFLLVLYATFLTRSGILGEASVHAFTDLGMSGQLLIYLLFFTGLAATLLLARWKGFPRSPDEHLLSREFWMFMGALVLAVSAFQIAFTTSIPVINKILSTNMAPPVDPVEHYNAWQVPFAVIICLLIGVGQFLKYKQTSFSFLAKKLGIPVGLSVLVCCISYGLLEVKDVFLLALLFASSFAVTTNAFYFVNILKGKIPKAGGSITHIGFGLIMLGALISNGKKDTISVNQTQYDLRSIGDNFNNRENTLLAQGDTVKMGDYHVVYEGLEREGIHVYYKVSYFEGDRSALSRAFTLLPKVQLNERMGNISEPSTKHFLSKDIFTHVTFAELEEKSEEDRSKTTNHRIGVGDTVTTSSHFIILNSFFNLSEKKELYNIREGEIAIGAQFRSINKQGHDTLLECLYVISDQLVPYSIPATDQHAGLTLTFEQFFPEEEKMELVLVEKDMSQAFIIMKAIIFPGINVLWLGCIIFLLGVIVSISQKIKQSRRA